VAAGDLPQVSSSFCEQKEPKKLIESGPQQFEHPGAKSTKVFAPLFSKSGRFLKALPELLISLAQHAAIR
jgi:hypothetical protein